MNKYLSAIGILMLFADSNAQFKKGYYYDKENNKVPGLIKLHYGATLVNKKSDGYCDITFKETDDGKHTRFTTTDINSFVIGSDSFAIVRDFYMDAYTHFGQDFAEVVETGKINLYRYYTTINFTNYTKTMTVWLVEKNGKINYIDKRRFKNEFANRYLADNPEIITQIKTKDLKFRDMQEIVKLYNDYFKQ